MKKLLLLVGMAPAFIVNAQTREGRVVYKREIQMQFQGRGIPEEMQRQLPKSRVDHFELIFGNNQSVFQTIPELNSDGGETTISSGNQVIRMRMPGSDDILYTNFDARKFVRQTEFMDQNFIIEDSIKSLPWKLTNETKTILGHPTMKATAVRIGTRPQVVMENGDMKRTTVADTTMITAWFAQDIPVSAGPDLQGQLPGLILELDMNNGRVHYQAEEIATKASLAGIKEPRKGKHVTQAEFEKERDKLMEQMRQYGGGNRTFRMSN